MTEPERLAISIVAHQLGQEVFVPGIAMLEAEEELRRRLKEEFDKLDSAKVGLERVTGGPVDVLTEPMPDIEEQLILWRERLGSSPPSCPSPTTMPNSRCVGRSKGGGPPGRAKKESTAPAEETPPCG